MLKSFHSWRNINIRLILLEQPINYEHDEDTCAFSRSMPEGCHSTSREPQIVNPLYYGWWCWDYLMFGWWSTTRFQSNSNQNFCLANAKFPRFLGAAGPWHLQCVAWLHCAWRWLVLQQGVIEVWHSRSVKDLPHQISDKHSCFPGSRSVRVCN